MDVIVASMPDETELVREASKTAGKVELALDDEILTQSLTEPCQNRHPKVIINLYAETHMDMLLPTLESGVTNTNWRIRDCSVALLGDFLYQVLPMWGCVE